MKTKIAVVVIACVLAWHLYSDYKDKVALTGFIRELNSTFDTQLRFDSTIAVRMGEVAKSTNVNHDAINILVDHYKTIKQ